jgi:hypothetical protein
MRDLMSRATLLHNHLILYHRAYIALEYNRVQCKAHGRIRTSQCFHRNVTLFYTLGREASNNNQPTPKNSNIEQYNTTLDYWHRDMNLVPSNLNGRRLSSSRTRLKELDDELKEIRAESQNSDMKAPPSALSLGHEYSHELDKASNGSWNGRCLFDVRARGHSYQCSEISSRPAHTVELAGALTISYQTMATLSGELRLATEDVQSSFNRIASLLQQLVDNKS